MDHDSTVSDRGDLARKLALTIGVTYTLVGIVGFFITGFDEFASRSREYLLWFEINPLHNIVHLIIGVAGLAMWRRVDTARMYGWALFLGYGLTFLYGLMVAGQNEGNFLSLNAADNVLHIVSALAGLGIAMLASSRSGAGMTSGRAAHSH